MTDHSMYSPIGAGTPSFTTTTTLPCTPNASLTPVLPTSPTATITESDELSSFPPTPEGLSRRRLNLFRRQRKAALKLAMLMAIELENSIRSPSTPTHSSDADMPAGYKRGDLGRQARKMFQSKDKHGMLSPSTHKVVKPAVVKHYQYKKCYKTAQKIAEMKSKKGVIRMR